MKAILVIDEPNNCSECSLQDGEKCYATGEAICSTSCPIKTIPMKMIPLAKLNEHEDGFCRGYNACIDMILGEKNEQRVKKIKTDKTPVW